MRTYFLSWFCFVLLLGASCTKDDEEDAADEDESASTSTRTSSDDDDDEASDEGPQGYFYTLNPSGEFVNSAVGRQLVQSFQVDGEVEITKVALYLKKVSGAGSSIYIYFGVGNESDGSEDMPWASSIKAESTGTLSEDGWIEFDLSQIGSLTFYPVTYYDIQVRSNNYPNDDLVFAWSKADKSYGKGCAWTEDPAPACGAFTKQSGYDFAFRLFSE